MFLSTVFPILITTHDGVRATGEDIVEVGRAEGANEFQILRKFILPASVPSIFTLSCGPTNPASAATVP